MDQQYNRNSNNRFTYNNRSNNNSYDNSNDRRIATNNTNNMVTTAKPLLMSNYYTAISVPAVSSLVTGLASGHPLLGAIGMIPAAALGDILYYKYNKKER